MPNAPNDSASIQFDGKLVGSGRGVDEQAFRILHNRRFPPPWSIDELQACLVVKDSAGQKLVIQI